MLDEDVTPRLWFGLDLFWDIIQDGSEYPQAVISAAADLFGHLVIWKSCKVVRVTFIEKCMDNVANARSVPQSLRIMKELICTRTTSFLLLA